MMHPCDELAKLKIRFDAIGVSLTYKLVQSQWYQNEQVLNIYIETKRKFSANWSIDNDKEIKDLSNAVDIATILHSEGFEWDCIRYSRYSRYGKKVLQFIYNNYIKLIIGPENYWDKNGYHCAISIKDKSGKYINKQTLASKFVDINYLLKAVQNAKLQPKLKIERNKIVIGEPHEFITIPKYISYEYNKDAWLIDQGLMDNAKLIGIVAIDGRNIIDCSNPSNDNVWFHIEGCAESRTFNIITDGSCWFQIQKFNKKWKIIPDTKKGLVIDLAYLNQFDVELIRFLIDRTCNDLAGIANDKDAK